MSTKVDDSDFIKMGSKEKINMSCDPFKFHRFDLCDEYKCSNLDNCKPYQDYISYNKSFEKNTDDKNLSKKIVKHLKCGNFISYKTCENSNCPSLNYCEDYQKIKSEKKTTKYFNGIDCARIGGFVSYKTCEELNCNELKICSDYQNHLKSFPKIEQENNDNVNNPLHYNIGIETIKYIESWNMNYIEGNIIKYVTRYKYKNKLEDLKKAEWYLKRLIEITEKENKTE
jgi:hypothetical protein